MSAARLAALALGVLALHVALLGSVAPHLAAVAPAAAPGDGAVPAPVTAVRALAPARRDEARDDARAPALPGRDKVVAAAQRPSQSPADATRPPLVARADAATFPLPRAAHAGADASLAPTASVPPAPIATDTGAESQATPVYATRPPPAFAFAYSLQRGAEDGAVEWRWQAQDGAYVARLEGRAGETGLIALRSSGGFDAAGLAPLRYTDRRRGRGTLAANFRRDTGSVSFSGPASERALAPGAQDPLSWMIQLAAIAAADPARVAAGGGVAMQVVGVRGEADVWRFEPLGAELIDLPDGATPTLRLQRVPQRAFDTRAEVWLDPARDHLPVRVRLANGNAVTLLQWQGVLRSP